MLVVKTEAFLPSLASAYGSESSKPRHMENGENEDRDFSMQLVSK